MKKLLINAENTMIRKSKYNLTIAGKNLEDIVSNNLPDLEEYKDYSASVKIEIVVLEDDLAITTEGYDVKKKESEGESRDGQDL